MPRPGLAFVLLALATLSSTSSCGDSDDSSNDGSSRAGSDQSFLDAVHDDAGLSAVTGYDPSDADLLRMGHKFCDNWKAAIADPVRMDGPLFVVQEMDRDLGPADSNLLHLVYMPAEDALCPELMK